jgi:hypothetical protein
MKHSSTSLAVIVSNVPDDFLSRSSQVIVKETLSAHRENV